MRVRAFAFLLSVMLFIVLAEVGSLLIGAHVIPGSPLSFILYNRQFEPDQEKVARYFAQRDLNLGWPAKDRLGTRAYDETGARPLPSFSPSAKPCVSVYGDSYTYSSHVGPADAWSNLVAQHMGCRVANYGVPGYGTDQAYLRFARHSRGGARFAILGVATVDIIRLVNQDRSLLWRAEQGLLLKPRFSITEDAQLTLIEMPSIGPAQLNQYLNKPERFLRHEWFMPGTRDGPTVFEMPYSIALLRGFTNPRVVNKLLGKPSWIQFYDREHPSGALRLLIRITEEFVRLAMERGMRPLVLIIPTSQDLIFAREEGVDPSASYVEELRERQVPHLDILPHMLQHLGKNDVCSVFTEKTWLGFCWGHYNAEGEEVIASLVYERLRKMDIFE
jgi:hypothetical protein